MSQTDLPSPDSAHRAAVSHDSAPSASPAQGVALALGATCIWGMFPLVFKAVAHIAPLEVLAHRSAWALVFAALLMALMGRREVFRRAFYAPRHVLMALLSGVAIAVNWGVFIWAVSNDQVLQSSLGYYISPLVSVLLGVVFLREHLRLWAWAAIALAGAGVVVLIVRVGEVPYVSLALAVSWALYGFARKLAPLGSLPGLYLETLVLSPVALGFLAWMAAQGGVEPFSAQAAVFATGWADSALLIMTGAVTALPLLLFARATRILRLTTIGVLMYIVPTGQFLLAVFAFAEPFTEAHLWAFLLIWAGLAVYGWNSVRRGASAQASGQTLD